MVHSAPFLSHILTLIPIYFNIHIQQGPLRPTVILFHVFLLLCELCIFKLLPIRTSMVHSAPLSFSSTYICILNSNHHIQHGPLRPTVILFHAFSRLSELCIFELFPIGSCVVQSAPFFFTHTYIDPSPF